MTTRKTAQNDRSEPAPSRGPVDAPGKRHRKPLPPERIDKKMGEPGRQITYFDCLTLNVAPAIVAVPFRFFGLPV